MADKFVQGEYFISELPMGGEILRQIADLLLPNNYRESPRTDRNSANKTIETNNSR